MSLSHALNVAGTGMNAQQLRLNTVASNLANAETVASSREEAYRAREPVFAAALQQAQGGNPGQGNSGAGAVTPAALHDPWSQAGPSIPVAMPGVVESDAEIEPLYKPHHPQADEDGYVYRSNVNSVDEMTNMISASRSFQNNVEVMKTTRDLMMDTIRIGR